jgi:membrane-bound lytic murein transglycosylase D
MLRALAVAAAALILATGALPLPTRAELLPRPPALDPSIRFWTRIYSEVDGKGGLIHDSDHLDIVYESIRLPVGASTRTRDRHVKKIKDKYRAILLQLARGKRTGLTAEQARVLKRWPEGTSNATLRRAANEIRFQLGQADKFRAGLIRSGAWRDYIEQVLEERGVPVELAALPHVESSYNPRAYSRVGAAGIWQFTRSTGRRYLRIDHVVDERLDPYRATVAAARLLHDNYEVTQSWPLAITAYNHGAEGMRRAVRKLGTRDIATIVKRYQSRTFGFASRNFYASFLAAVGVDRDALRYFGALDREVPVEYETAVLPHYYPASSLGRALGVDPEEIRSHNLSLRPAVWDGVKYVPRGFELRVPRDSLVLPIATALERIPAAERLAQQHRDRYHKVRRGETLSKIARRYGVQQRQLVALNNLRSRHRIRAGQVLVLPDSAHGGSIPVLRETRPADGIYRVRRGDTVSIIARRFGVSEAELVALNLLRNRHRITVGQRLRLPGSPPALIAAAPPADAERPRDPERSRGETAPIEKTAARQTQPVVLAKASASAGEPAAEGAVASLSPPLEPPDNGNGDGGDAERSAARMPPEVDRGEAAEAAAPPPEQEEVALGAPAPPAPDPSNYAVSSGHTITVQAEETLGHYADWLEVRTSSLRRLNRMRPGKPVVIGRRARLDFSRVTPETFERRRLEYHQTLQAEFFASYIVSDTEPYVLRQGDTLWYLARRKFEVPVWLLHLYNPDLDFGSLPAGTTMIVPLIEPQES